MTMAVLVCYRDLMAVGFDVFQSFKQKNDARIAGYK